MYFFLIFLFDFSVLQTFFTPNELVNNTHIFFFSIAHE